MFDKAHHLTPQIFHGHPWNKDVIEYYIFKVMKTISFSLLALFVPVYLYSEVGYSIFEIMIFFVINQILFIALTPFSGQVIKYLGVKHSMAISLPSMALFIYLLRYLKGNFWEEILLIIGLLLIRVVPKFQEYVAETIFISKSILTSKKQEGKSLALIKISLIFGTLLAPLVGGAIIFIFGFNYFFTITIIFLLLSTIPLLLTKDKYFKFNESSKQIWKFTFSKVSKNFKIAEFGRCFANSIVWLLWPLFLFLLVKNTQKMGSIVSIAGILAIIVSYYVGKKIDKTSPKNLLKRISRLATGLFFFRALFPTPTLLIITDAVNKVVDPILMIPYEKYKYEYIKSLEGLVEISIASAILMQIAYGLGFLVLAIAFGVLEFLEIEPSFWFFVGLFFVFGSFLLLMQKIEMTQNIN